MKRRTGFTLAESLLAVTLLAVGVVAITMPFTAGAQNEQDDVRRTLGAALAQEMMEEILAKPFNDPDGPSAPGPETGESSRAAFDNIDDYHSYDEPAGSVTDAYGSALSEKGATGLSRHVSVVYVYVAGQDIGESPTFARITVEVRYQGDELLTVTRLKYAYPGPGPEDADLDDDDDDDDDGDKGDVVDEEDDDGDSEDKGKGKDKDDDEDEDDGKGKDKDDEDDGEGKGKGKDK